MKKRILSVSEQVSEMMRIWKKRLFLRSDKKDQLEEKIMKKGK